MWDHGALAVNVWGFVLETLFYGTCYAFVCWSSALSACNPGLYLLLFALSWYVHRCYARSRSEGGSYRAGKFMVALSFLLFALITTVNPELARQRLFVDPSYRQNWILGFFRFYQAFVVQGEVPGGTTVYLESLTDPAWVAQASVYALSRLLMDMLLVSTHTPTVMAANDLTVYAGRSSVYYLELEALDRCPSHRYGPR